MIQVLFQLDLFLFELFNQRIANQLFDIFFPFITEEKHFVLPLLLIWLGLLLFGGKRGRLAALLIVIATGVSDFIAAQYIKPTVGRLRPCHALETVRLLVNCGGKYGFVSNHAANMFASMSVLSYFFRDYKYYFYIIASLIAFSRIYVGVHYPADVLFGSLFGYVMAFIFIQLLIKLNQREIQNGRHWLDWQPE